MAVPLLDPHLNLARSTVAVAPSPATSGTSLTVATGDGAKFPTTSAIRAFNCLVWPAGVDPTTANAEMVRCTARAADVFTIVRTQEALANRSIVVGDQIALVMSAKSFTDIESLLSTFEGNQGVFVNQTNTAAAFAMWVPNPPLPAGTFRLGDILEQKLSLHLINGTGAAHTYTTTFGFGLSGVLQVLIGTLTLSVPAATVYDVFVDIFVECINNTTQYAKLKCDIFNVTTQVPGTPAQYQALTAMSTFNTDSNNYGFLHTAQMDAASASMNYQGYPGFSRFIRAP
jgi:hypothetical protein